MLKNPFRELTPYLVRAETSAPGLTCGNLAIGSEWSTLTVPAKDATDPSAFLRFVLPQGVSLSKLQLVIVPPPAGRSPDETGKIVR